MAARELWGESRERVVFIVGGERVVFAYVGGQRVVFTGTCSVASEVVVSRNRDCPVIRISVGSHGAEGGSITCLWPKVCASALSLVLASESKVARLRS